jgi:Family of unknown function (DUF5709)
MPLGWRHESADLRDFEVLDAFDTLAGPPGDDPLDRGVIPPLRWSPGMRFGTTAGEQAAGESHDRLLSEEEPDAAAVDDIAWDENATDDDIDRFSLHQTPDPRTGRLVADEGTYFPAPDDDLVARDAGIDGGGASAEEAAVHVLVNDDADTLPGTDRA